MRAVVPLKVPYHVEHGLICETLAKDGFNDPLFTLLCHARLRVLLLHQLEQVHVIQRRLAVVRYRTLVKHQLVFDCLQLAFEIGLISLELVIYSLLSHLLHFA